MKTPTWPNPAKINGTYRYDSVIPFETTDVISKAYNVTAPNEMPRTSLLGSFAFVNAQRQNKAPSD